MALFPGLLPYWNRNRLLSLVERMSARVQNSVWHRVRDRVPAMGVHEAPRLYSGSGGHRNRPRNGTSHGGRTDTSAGASRADFPIGATSCRSPIAAGKLASPGHPVRTPAQGRLIAERFPRH